MSVEDKITEVAKQAESVAERKEMALKAYGDKDIYEAELERIFGKTWIFLGHEAEIPDPGDYAVRYIADTPLIFVRDENGDVQAHFDSCRHRGATVVRAEEGNTSHFRCPYHGWTYKNTGELIAVPGKDDYYKDLDTCEWSLKSVADIESYRGFVFATLSSDAPSLDEYLGGVKWYLDLAFDPFESEMELIHGPQKFNINSNWKVPAENFTPDVYHSPVTHKTAIDAGIVTRIQIDPSQRWGHKIICDGHTLLVQEMEGKNGMFFGYPDGLELGDHLSETQREIGARATSFIGTLFPNFSFIHQFLSPVDSDREAIRYLGIRKWRPLGPDKTEFLEWSFVPEDLPEDFKEDAGRLTHQVHGAGGIFEQDDTAVWEGIADAAGSLLARKDNPKLNYEMDENDAMKNREVNDQWPGPGTAYRALQNDSTMYTFLRNWGRVMQGKEFGQ